MDPGLNMRRGYYETRPSENGTLFYLSIFHEECVERIKDEIPAKERRWDPDEEAWWISEEYLDEAEGIIGEYFDES